MSLEGSQSLQQAGKSQSTLASRGSALLPSRGPGEGRRRSHSGAALALRCPSFPIQGLAFGDV